MAINLANADEILIIDDFALDPRAREGETHAVQVIWYGNPDVEYVLYAGVEDMVKRYAKRIFDMLGVTNVSEPTKVSA